VPTKVVSGNSLTDEERSQIEERIEQLVRDNPTLSQGDARPLDSKTEPPSVSAEVFEEYSFLRDMAARWMLNVTASNPCPNFHSQRGREVV
jgi:hypothetical protein